MLQNFTFHNEVNLMHITTITFKKLTHTKNMTYANRKINIKQSLMHPIPCNCNLHNTEVLEWYLFLDILFFLNKYDWTKCYINRPKVHHETHPLNGPLSGTTQVSRYHKGKTNLDFTEARDSEWQWHQLGRMQVCT